MKSAMYTSGNSTGNITSPPTMDPFHATHYGYAVYFAVLVPITVTSNLLLLVTLYKDPLRCFRTPVTYFVVALASVDLVIGLFVEPSFAAYYFVLHRRKVDKTEPISILLRVILWTSNACLNISFLQILMLTVSQFVAITFPHSYKTLVTARRVLLSLALSSLYFVLFTLLQFTGASQLNIYKTDLYLHSTAITCLIALSSAFLFVSFRRFNKLSRSVGHNSIQVPERQRQGNSREPRQQITRSTMRQFTIITLSLSGLLLFTAVPHIVATYIRSYHYPSSPAAISTFKIVDRVCSGLMFIKVALDAFIFAWRLPKYRRALRIVVGCSGVGQISENTLDTLPNISGKI